MNERVSQQALTRINIKETNKTLVITSSNMLSCRTQGDANNRSILFILANVTNGSSNVSGPHLKISKHPTHTRILWNDFNQFEHYTIQSSHLVLKAQLDLAPKYLCDLIFRSISDTSLRPLQSSDRLDLFAPRVSRPLWLNRYHLHP